MDKDTDVSLEDRWNAFLVEYERVLVEFNRKFSQLTAKEAVFCKEGCSNCCCQIFQETSAQVEIVVRHLKSSPKLMDKYRKQSELRKQIIANNDEKLREVSAIKNSHEFMIAWLALKIPCAFLDDHRCMIYDIRPMPCAAYVTLTPPRVCSIEPKGYMSPAIGQLKADFKRVLGELCRKYNVKPELIFDLSWHVDRYLKPNIESSGDGN